MSWSGTLQPPVFHLILEPMPRPTFGDTHRGIFATFGDTHRGIFATFGDSHRQRRSDQLPAAPALTTPKPPPLDVLRVAAQGS